MKVHRPPLARPTVTEITPVNGGEGITILELSKDQCHAVIGSSRPKQGLPRYCGHPVWEGEPYCAGHYLAFHQPPKPR